MFNKEEYWKNRKAGKRGQGQYPKLTKLSKDSEPLPPTRKALLKNTKQYRKVTA